MLNTTFDGHYIMHLIGLNKCTEPFSVATVINVCQYPIEVVTAVSKGGGEKTDKEIFQFCLHWAVTGSLSCYYSFLYIS